MSEPFLANHRVADGWPSMSVHQRMSLEMFSSDGWRDDRKCVGDLARVVPHRY